MKYLYDEPFSFYSNDRYRAGYDQIDWSDDGGGGGRLVEVLITTDPCDLLCCPGCGDHTESDRCVPPTPYYCEECSREIIGNDSDPTA